jgi:hypothetical protein
MDQYALCSSRDDPQGQADKSRHEVEPQVGPGPLDDSVNSMNSPDFIMAGSDDYRVVTLSVLISILAAYASREFIHRVRGARRPIWLAWLAGGDILTQSPLKRIVHFLM